MGSTSIALTGDTDSPNCINATGYFVAVPETYAQMLAATGNVPTGYINTPGQPHVDISKTSGDAYLYLKSTVIGLDLRALSMVTFTAGSFTANIHTISYIPATPLWENVSDYDSVVMSGMPEDVIGINFTDTVHYTEVNKGFGVIGDYSNRILMGSFSAGSNATWTMNSAGIAYLNTVATKSDLTAYAYLTLIFGGQSDGIAPTYALGRTQSIGYDYTYGFSVSLSFTSPIQINVGDVWKDVVAVQCNVNGSSWNYVVDLKLNVGDVWKDIK